MDGSKGTLSGGEDRGPSVSNGTGLDWPSVGSTRVLGKREHMSSCNTTEIEWLSRYNIIVYERRYAQIVENLSKQR